MKTELVMSVKETNRYSLLKQIELKPFAKFAFAVKIDDF